jgi:hypothetical protein
MDLLTPLATSFTVFGVVLGMALGILGTAFNLKDETTKRMTRWGWLSVFGIVLTGMLTLAAQYVNSKQEKLNLAEAKKQKGEQLQAELDRFQKLVSQFQTTHTALLRISTSLSDENNRSAAILTNLGMTQIQLKTSADTLTSLEAQSRETVMLLDSNSRQIGNLVAAVVLEIPIGKNGKEYLKRARKIREPMGWTGHSIRMEPGVIILSTRKRTTNDVIDTNLPLYPSYSDRVVTRLRIEPDSPFYPVPFSPFDEDASFRSDAYNLINGSEVNVAIFGERRSAVMVDSVRELDFKLTGGDLCIDIKPDEEVLVVERTAMTWDKLNLLRNVSFNSLDNFKGKTIKVTLLWRDVFVKVQIAGEEISEPKLSERMQLRMLVLSFDGRRLWIHDLPNKEVVEDTQTKTSFIFTFPNDTVEFLKLWE